VSPFSVTWISQNTQLFYLIQFGNATMQPIDHILPIKCLGNKLTCYILLFFSNNLKIKMKIKENLIFFFKKKEGVAFGHPKLPPKPSNGP
jgi:hypothetical protein